MTRSMILVPLDGYTAAVTALRYAIPIARTTGAGIRLLAVCEPVPIGMSGRSVEASLTLEKARREALAADLVASSEWLDAGGVQGTSSLMAGDPDETILAEAASPDVWLVVMATHARSGVSRWFVGSVADAVMRRSSVPVLLIPPAEASAETTPVHMGRLVVPLDGSDLAEAALPLAGDLAAALSATLVLVRVEALVAGMIPDAVIVPATLRMEDQVVAEAYAYLRSLRGRLPAEITVETVVVRGAPGPALTEFAHESGANMVIMTTHGRGGLRRLALGSVADHMVRSGRPTLLVRPGQWTQAIGHEDRMTSAVEAAGPHAIVTRDPWSMGSMGWTARGAGAEGANVARLVDNRDGPCGTKVDARQREENFVWIDDLGDDMPSQKAAPRDRVARVAAQAQRLGWVLWDPAIDRYAPGPKMAESHNPDARVDAETVALLLTGLRLRSGGGAP